MAIIGTFTTGSAGFTGTIQTLTLKAQVTFEPADKKNANAPDYRVFHHTDSFTSEIGAAWKKPTDAGKAHRRCHCVGIHWQPAPSYPETADGADTAD